MPEATLRLVIRTPHAVVTDEPVVAARVPTHTGLAGLRPRGEPMVLGVEPGVVVLRRAGAPPRFAATAGGLLESDRETCTLYTPYAVVGDSEAQMLEALAQMVAAPSGELLARRQLGELEQRIVHELGQRPHPAATAGRRPSG